MNIRPDRFIDRGCWISDDRVYAFVSSATNSIAEIGYHGAQPVSKNSRVFAGVTTVCQFAVFSADRVKQPLVFEEFDWYAAGVHILGRCGNAEVLLDIAGSGRSVVVQFSSLPAASESVSVRFSKEALFTRVHGERRWNVDRASRELLALRFRDRILLNEWMKREGRYAGDFLIPEPLRRKIFGRRCRSGLATRDDLLPEYLDAPMPIYDAEVSVHIGGLGYMLREEKKAYLFSAMIPAGATRLPPFVISFDDEKDPNGVRGEPAELRARYSVILDCAPTLDLPSCRSVESFFLSAPALVESCVIHDYGIPRATPGAYYWIWAWDAMVTATAALRWGATRTARRTAEFVHTHRDEGDLIPMRWTRELVPLDTQPHGSLETLLATLVHAASLESNEPDLLQSIYPSMVRHFGEVSKGCDARGLFANIGFYPDLPVRFGRKESSAVAAEVGGFYTFCRMCENIALQMGDHDTARRAGQMIAALERAFLSTFWDEEKGFLVDSIDLATGRRNLSFPLFTLLFLHSSLGLALIRPKLAECADFIGNHLLSDLGLRALPSWDRNSGSEIVMGSWYPHWDAYALKILRRAGRSEAIMKWLRSVERVLERLGFCPEYLPLEGVEEGDSARWLRHGSPSNLNCVTGWYTALLNGLFGIEFDTGGLTIIPLGLPIDKLCVKGIRYRGANWDISVQNHGAFLEKFILDEQELRGCLKIPSRFYDGGGHRIELVYGTRKSDWHFKEILNAEVIEIDAGANHLDLRVLGKGRVDLLLHSPEPCELLLDDKSLSSVSNRDAGELFLQVPIVGEHVITAGRTI
jgi:hypothetical protein